MIDTVESLKARRNGKLARPNVRSRNEPRETTDSFLLAAAGLDTDRPSCAWWRRITVWQLAGLTLLAVALLVAMRVW